MERKPRPKRRPEPTLPDEEHIETAGPKLGRAEDAGHPGGAQDKKDETVLRADLPGSRRRIST